MLPQQPNSQLFVVVQPECICVTSIDLPTNYVILQLEALPAV